MTKRKIRIGISILAALLLTFGILCFAGVNRSYNQVFSRCSVSDFEKSVRFKYADFNTAHLQREVFTINSGKNRIECFLYGKTNDKGLIVISCGHRTFAEENLAVAAFFVSKGWKVLCYDYTGCRNSEGESMIGYQQSADDLHAVLQYLSNSKRFRSIPVMLYGHSLGAYASTAVLQYKDSNVKAAIAASGFSDPVEQWDYSVRRFTGAMGPILAPFARLVVHCKYPGRAHFTAIDGINSTNIPILILQGTDDEYYGKVSSIYQHRDQIRNKNCRHKLMDNPLRHGHYNYLMSERAFLYMKLQDGKSKAEINRELATEVDTTLFDEFDNFYKRVL